MRSPLFQLRDKRLGIGSVEAVAVLVNCDLRNDRNRLADIFCRQDGLVNLLQISEGFQNKKIYASLNQRFDLLAESVARFLIRSLAQRFDSGSQWANRTCNPYIEAFGGFPGQSDPGAIDVEYPINQAVTRQPECVGAERIGFNDFSASLQVVVV